MKMMTSDELAEIFFQKNKDIFSEDFDDEDLRDVHIALYDLLKEGRVSYDPKTELFRTFEVQNQMVN